MRKFIALVIGLFILPTLALAEAKPTEIASTIHAASPVGRTEMHKLMFHVYDASFWSDSGSTLQPPYALSIVYDMDFSKGDLIDRTVTELKHVSNLPDDRLQKYAMQLGGIWPDIQENDRLTAFTFDARATVFYYNGKKIGTINDADFTTAFFGIWVSPKTSEPQMRKELLGK